MDSSSRSLFRLRPIRQGISISSTLTYLLVLGTIVSTTAMGISAEPTADDWVQWRGPTRDGKVAEGTWPDDLKGLEPTWEVELAPSYSSPVVLGDRVFVTETRDRKYEVVQALDRATGEQIWETQWEGSLSVPFFAKANGDWIRSSPATDGEHLYVAGIRDVLVCLDIETGEIVWEVNFVERFESSIPSFGFVSSPLILGDAVYVQAGGGFVKLDKQTGETIWRVLDDGGGMYGSAFSSPVFVTLAGIPQLIVQTRTELTGVSEDGDVLWRQEIPAFRGMNILTPTVIGDAIFTSSYGGGSFLFSAANDGEWKLNEEWKNKLQGYMSSPVIVDNHLYLHLRNQRFACIDLATGEQSWITKPFGKYWSMLVNGDKMLALDEGGELLLIRANPSEFELLDEKQVADDSWAHVVVTGNQVFVRDLAKLQVFQWNP